MDYFRFGKKLLLLAFPFLLLAAFVAWTDPFCLLQTPFIERAIKEKAAFPLNSPLARLIEFSHHPGTNILLGDSRMGLLSPDEIEKASGIHFLNMSYGGASLNEVVDTFWATNRANALQRVYMGIGFSLYNDYNFTNRTEPVQSIIASPLLYFTNRTVLKGAWLTALLRYGGRDPEIGKPRDRQTLWAEELQAHSNWSQRYMAPTRYRARLQEISEYSRKHGIELRFIIFPREAELQAIPHRYGLDAEYAAFKRDLAAFGRVYDYDIPSAYSADEANYADPVHFRAPVEHMIIQDIWGSPKPVQ